MKTTNLRSKLIAIITGVISILIAVAYLLLITVLDLRGNVMSPPPPEAMNEVVIGDHSSV